MCELTGKTEEEIFADLKGVIFLNPMHGYGNSTQAKYLSLIHIFTALTSRNNEHRKKGAQDNDRFHTATADRSRTQIHLLSLIHI